MALYLARAAAAAGCLAVCIIVRPPLALQTAAVRFSFAPKLSAVSGSASVAASAAAVRGTPFAASVASVADDRASRASTPPVAAAAAVDPAAAAMTPLLHPTEDTGAAAAPASAAVV
jgi:hypothetical protein